jgi:sugar phosphate isomerase/epimerase
MGVLLDEFGPAVGYWHDVGHAFRLEALGFWPQEAWLQRFATRLVGVHLHDSIGMEDHRPPGQGRAPFGLISSFLPGQCLRVFEVKDTYSGEAVAAGLAHLRALGVLR